MNQMPCISGIMILKHVNSTPSAVEIDLRTPEPDVKPNSGNPGPGCITRRKTPRVIGSLPPDRLGPCARCGETRTLSRTLRLCQECKLKHEKLLKQRNRTRWLQNGRTPVQLAQPEEEPESHLCPHCGRAMRPGSVGCYRHSTIILMKRLRHPTDDVTFQITPMGLERLLLWEAGKTVANTDGR